MKQSMALDIKRAWKTVVLLIGLVCAVAVKDSVSSQEEIKDKAVELSPIALITWRGITDAEQGFIDSMNKSPLSIRIDIYHAHQDRETLNKIISRIKQQPYKLIYTFGTTVTKSVIEKEKTTPVVFNIVNRPVLSGIVKSWEQSGNNATGASNQVPVENQLRTLKKVVNFSRLGIIYNPLEQNSVIQCDIIHGLKSQMDFEMLEFKISRHADVSRVIPTIKGRVDAVYIPADSFTISIGSQIAKLINRYKLPSLAAVESMVTEDGILLGLVPDFYQLGELAAKKATRILQGESPGDIPSSILKYFNISINMKTAHQINVQIPLSILVIANNIVR